MTVENYLTDVIAFGPHPDDVELFCGGTIAKLSKAGYKVGIVDLTRGELGTRGTEQEREAEATEAAEILGVSFRTSLNLPDGELDSRNKEQQLEVIKCIRAYRPRIVMGPFSQKRHPDHQQGMKLIQEACFFSNVTKVLPELDRHKVKAVALYNMSWHGNADYVVDISDTWEIKKKAVTAFKSQFGNTHLDKQETYLSSELFLDWVKGRASHYGSLIKVAYGEPFVLAGPLPVGDLVTLMDSGTGDANP